MNDKCHIYKITVENDFIAEFSYQHMQPSKFKGI